MSYIYGRCFVMNQGNQTTTRSKHELRWLKMYSLYTEFKEKFNREPEPNEIYEGENLGKWVSGQRRADGHNAWPKIRKEVLGNAGIEACGLETKANKMIKLYLAFKKEYLREPKYNEIYHDENLGKWIKDQRSLTRRGKLSPKRQNLLQSAGVDLFVDLKEIQWDHACSLYIEYIQKYGRGPHANEKYKDVCLGLWVKTQRHRAETEKDLLLLQYKSFLSKNNYSKDPLEVYWEKMYSLCLRFIKAYNRMPIRNEQYWGKPLGNWFIYQNKLKKYNWLSNEQISLLEQLHENIQPREPKVEIKIPEGENKVKWDKACLLYIEYVQLNGCGPEKNEKFKRVNLGQWVSSQMPCWKKDREYLQQRYQALLSKNGYSEDPLEIYWEEMYSLFYEYVQTNNKTPQAGEVYLDKPLGNWLAYQVKLMKYNCLSDEQYRRLALLNTKKTRRKNNQI